MVPANHLIIPDVAKKRPHGRHRHGGQTPEQTKVVSKAAISDLLEEVTQRNIPGFSYISMIKNFQVRLRVIWPHVRHEGNINNRKQGTWTTE